MEITKEDLKKRIDQAKSESENLKIQYNRIQGIITDCEYWIIKLDGKSKESSEKPELVKK